MDKDIWKEKYIKFLMTHGDLTHSEAEDVFHAGVVESDFDEDPEDLACSEMSYWTDDG